MTLLNLFSPRARVSVTDTRCNDRSVMLMIWLLLGLVFAPVIGLHVAAGMSHAAPVASDVVQTAEPSKPSRG